MMDKGDIRCATFRPHLNDWGRIDRFASYPWSANDANSGADFVKCIARSFRDLLTFLLVLGGHEAVLRVLANLQANVLIVVAWHDDHVGHLVRLEPLVLFQEGGSTKERRLTSEGLSLRRKIW